MFREYVRNFVDLVKGWEYGTRMTYEDIARVIGMPMPVDINLLQRVKCRAEKFLVRNVIVPGDPTGGSRPVHSVRIMGEGGYELPAGRALLLLLAKRMKAAGNKHDNAQSAFDNLPPEAIEEADAALCRKLRVLASTVTSGYVNAASRYRRNRNGNDPIITFRLDF